MLSWWAHWRAADTNTSTSLDSRTPTHTQHKEVSPFSATQSLRPWSPFQCYSGVVEKKSNPLALFLWVPNHQVYQAPQALIHQPKIVWRQIHCMQAAKQLFKRLQGKTQSNKSWQMTAHDQPWAHSTQISLQSLGKLTHTRNGKYQTSKLCVRDKMQPTELWMQL